MVKFKLITSIDIFLLSKLWMENKMNKNNGTVN